ncbi:MAG: DUF2089 family protein [Candidatus Hydrogenedentes bacterium]|nr:DUF2089 family protein [Candidatus Hydrogenedentota bacterium]
MSQLSLPPWLSVFNDADLLFLKRFLLASGSLKQLAEVYGVSYPTIRARLDRLIERVNAVEAPATGDSFEQLVETLVTHGVMLTGTGRTLLQTHRRILKETTERAARNATSPPTEDEWQE